MHEVNIDYRVEHTCMNKRTNRQTGEWTNLITVLGQHAVQKIFSKNYCLFGGGGDGETVAVDYSRWPFQVGEGETKHVGDLHKQI